MARWTLADLLRRISARIPTPALKASPPITLVPSAPFRPTPATLDDDARYFSELITSIRSERASMAWSEVVQRLLRRERDLDLDLEALELEFAQVNGIDRFKT